MITKALSDTRSTNITILTGPIKSGKTTFLMELLENNPDCGGFLTPDIHGRRHFFRLDTKECLPFEIDPTSDKYHSIAVGPYYFDKNIFDLGNQMISNIQSHHKKIFVIDEVGKLELRGEGFDLSLKIILPLYSLNDDTLLILIVRNYLVHEVMERYKLNCTIIDILEKEKIQLKLGI